MRYRKYRKTKYSPPSPPSPRILAGGALALLVPFVAALLWAAEKPEQVRAPAPVSAVAPQAQSAPAAAGAAAPSRPVYRYSVIPGGVRSAAELASAVQRDRAVSAHYADFDVAAAHLVRVEKPRFVHVSYRIGDKIYWTKKKLKLAAGESLLSDGTHLARTRCGNRIAEEVQGPVLDTEPASEMLDLVFASADDPDEANKAQRARPLASVPEPGSASLVGVALLVLALVRRGASRKRRG
jgi:hypothetical protein